MKTELKVDFAGVPLKNPLVTASGTYNPEASGQFYDPSILGAVTLKGVSAEAWQGNPTPRIAETYGGMLNSVGLQNPGAAEYLAHEIPYMEQFDTKVIVNLAGHSIEEYERVTEMLCGADRIDMFELNISCPNVKEGGMTFGTDARMAEQVVKAVKRIADKPLIVKLSPNVTDITEIARAAVAGGADALSLINTLLGMRIDLRTRKPVIANKLGGFSGPAIFPVALRMVYQCAKAVKLPIIGVGGIASAEDVLEMMMAGATAVQVGAENLRDPYACKRIIEALPETMTRYGIRSISEIVGVTD